MIPRYTRPEMAELWSDARKLDTWLEVELVACEEMARLGLVPQDAAKRLRQGRFSFSEDDVRKVAEIENTTRHDVIAFLTFLEQRLGPDARHLHLGMTSSDVLDTSLAVLLNEACGLILGELDGLREVMRERVEQHRHTVMVGRTHGIHAEPLTFGLVLALWWAELGRQRARIEAARSSVAVGKLSGAVGTFAHLPYEIEQRVCQRLGLGAEPVSNQVVQRDRHAELFCALANLGSTLEKIAVNIRHLQRTEVAEVWEPFGKGQKGSSAMPHKKNPIGCENLTGVARLLRSYAQAALENVALWHERDISHSSVERVICPDATTLAHYALGRMKGIVSGMEVDAERMRQNLELTGGLVYSQKVLLELVRSGLGRQRAYECVQAAALRAWRGEGNFRSLLERDGEVMSRLGAEGIAACFDHEKLLQNVDRIIDGVLGKD
ncbi:MAG: adenylosuccinate lyase [Deltaproteobacteria bacterium]|nr:MAG: adenylosuccinate lyase [Deltaproteobacteria bacterium]